MGVVRTGLTKTVGQSNAQVVTGSLRLDRASSQYLTRTPSTVGNRRTWTISCWIKFSKFSTENDGDYRATFIGANNFNLEFWPKATLRISGSQTGDSFNSLAKYRDTSAWYHLVVACDTTLSSGDDRFKIYMNGVRQANNPSGSAYQGYTAIAQNYQTEINNTQAQYIGVYYNLSGFVDLYLSNFYLIDGQALDASYFGFTDPLTNTWRPKKFKSGAATINDGRTWSSNYGNLRTAGTQTNPFDADNTNYAQVSDSGGYFSFPDGLNGRLEVLASTGQPNNGDSTQTVTISNNSGVVTSRTTSRGYNNGAETLDFGVVSGITSISFTYQGLFWEFRVNSIQLRDGITETIGFGTNGCYLPFDTDGAGDIGIGTDRSGRGNHWTANGFVTTAAGITTNPNIVPDSPSGISFSTTPTAGIGTTTGMTKPSNYATWNPLKMGTSDVSMSEGNLLWRTTSNGPDRITVSTLGMTSGKYYWENEVVEATATGIGIANDLANQDAGPASTHNWMYYSATGQAYLDGSASAYGAAYNTNGTFIGVAFDRDNLTLEFYKDGISQGKLTNISGLTDTETYYAMCGDSGGASQSQVRVNFGQKPFKYAPPSGFLPLCTANLPRPTTDAVVRPDKYVGIVTYTGNGGTQIINVGFKPDLVWFKARNNTYSNALIDSVRGGDKTLYSDQTSGEASLTGGISSWNRTGFTAVVDTSNANSVNTSSTNIVAWAWKAGGNSNTYNINDVGYATTTAAGLTGGTINPTGASVNTKSGFSIITYTGTGSAGSVPHGLGKEPYMIILKTRGVSDDWRVYHKFLDSVEPEDYYLMLQSTVARSADQGASFMNDTAPTSTTFSLGTDSAINGSTRTMIAYCWAEIPGFSKFGSYTGNNSTDGPVVITGFRPAFVLIRQARTDATGRDWMIFDNKRSVQYGAGGFNVISTYLYPNYNNAEANAASIDFLSNGFKIRASDSTNNNINGSSQNHIYAAFAESPTQNLYGGQSNAR